METPSKCLTCPREVIHQQAHKKLDSIRDLYIQGGEAILDEQEAKEFGAALHAAGLLKDPNDTQLIRQLTSQGLEILDLFEKALDQERVEETRFCIGALHLRAKDIHGQYDVTICRSPESQSKNGIEDAVVTRRSIS